MLQIQFDTRCRIKKTFFCEQKEVIKSLAALGAPVSFILRLMLPLPVCPTNRPANNSCFDKTNGARSPAIKAPTIISFPVSSLLLGSFGRWNSSTGCLHCQSESLDLFSGPLMPRLQSLRGAGSRGSARWRVDLSRMRTATGESDRSVSLKDLWLVWKLFFYFLCRSMNVGWWIVSSKF